MKPAKRNKDEGKVIVVDFGWRATAMERARQRLERARLAIEKLVEERLNSGRLSDGSRELDDWTFGAIDDEEEWEEEGRRE